MGRCGVSLPRPPALRRDLEAIADLVDPKGELLEEYRWAHSIAYGRLPAGGEDPKVRHIHKADPTGNVATGDPQRRARKLAGLAVEAIEHALGDLREALNLMRDAAPRGGSRIAVRDMRKKSVTTVEYRRLRDAQDRRASRGEGYGES